jgi:hypothetical protein
VNLGEEFVRGLLGAIDEAVRGTDAWILAGRAQSHEQYVEQVARRRALLEVRAEIVLRIGDDARGLLGLPPGPRAGRGTREARPDEGNVVSAASAHARLEQKRRDGAWPFVAR